MLDICVHFCRVAKFVVKFLLNCLRLILFPNFSIYKDKIKFARKLTKKKKKNISNGIRMEESIYPSSKAQSMNPLSALLNRNRASIINHGLIGRPGWLLQLINDNQFL